jgi:UDP-GlcNAc:undecaprenyl-phosphate/decaprenyl-phosphate GlcNAc-1-phosphate transferase
MIPSAVAALGAFLITLALTPLAGKAAFRLNILDHPDRKLKLHEKPVPYLGGLAVYLGFTAALVGVKVWQHGMVIGVVGILAGSALITGLGLIDDKRQLSPGVKFAGQFTAAAILVACNMRLQFIQEPVTATLLSLLWVVGITNAMNLIDIMDGLSTGVAVTAAAAFFVVMAENGRYNDMYIVAALGGAALGFLPYNFPKAKIYLGDTGALLLGFVLSAVAMGGGYSRTNSLAVLAPILILGVPIFDTLFIMFLRQRRGVSMFRGSPDHLALRMVRLGLSRQQTAVILWGVSALLGAAAYLSTNLSLQGSLFLYGAAGLAALFIAERMGSFSMEKHS